jgi:hypothetical protein
MRSIHARLVVATLAGVLLAPLAFGQPAAPPAARPGPAASRGAERPPLSVARGIVKTIQDNRLVIDAGQPPAGQPAPATAFVLDGETRFRRLGRPMTAKDLRVGDAVTVGYVMRGDKAVASRVWLRRAGPTAAAPRPAGAQAR